MRILADATAVGEGGGGICTFLLGLLAGWTAAGFEDEWRVVGMSDLPRAVDDLVMSPGRVLRGRSPSVVHRILAQQVLLPAMACGSWSPDVILATTPVIPVTPLRSPVVAMVHDLRSLRFPSEFTRLVRTYRRIAYRYGLARADGLLANSDFTRDEVQQVARHRRSNPVVISLGADHVDDWPAVSPGPEDGQGHGITFAHWSNKRPDVAIRAWALLHDTDDAFAAKLHVVGGRAAEIGGLIRLSSELHINHLVQVHPFLPEHEYRDLFASSSVVLLPSTMEGFGLPVAEAQRLGIPVVATAVGGISEVGGDAALYSTDGSPSSFAALCAQILFDPGRRDELIRRGRERSGHFTWRSTAERTRCELERIVVRRRARSVRRITPNLP